MAWVLLGTGGNILSLNFLFSHSKVSDTNIGIVANVLGVCENPDLMRLNARLVEKVVLKPN